MGKISANSGDSHFPEPETLWRDNLPTRLAELVPRSVKDPDGEWETVHIDGMAFRRKLATSTAKEFANATSRAPGASDVALRMKDLDQEGVWGEVVFHSLGMRSSSFRTPEVLREALRVSNDWSFETLEKHSPRPVTTGQPIPRNVTCNRSCRSPTAHTGAHARAKTGRPRPTMSRPAWPLRVGTPELRKRSEFEQGRGCHP